MNHPSIQFMERYNFVVRLVWLFRDDAFVYFDAVIKECFNWLRVVVQHECILFSLFSLLSIHSSVSHHITSHDTIVSLSLSSQEASDPRVQERLRIWEENKRKGKESDRLQEAARVAKIEKKRLGIEGDPLSMSHIYIYPSVLATHIYLPPCPCHTYIPYPY